MATKTGEIREMLIEAIEQVRAGKMPPENAKAIAMLAQQLNSSLQVEINVVKEMRALGILKKGGDLGSLAVGETIAIAAA